MKFTILFASPRKDGNTAALLAALCTCGYPPHRGADLREGEP